MATLATLPSACLLAYLPAYSALPVSAAPPPQVLVEWRAKDPGHAAWVAAIKDLLAALKVGQGVLGSLQG